MSSPLQRKIQEIGIVDQIGVEQRVAKFTTRSLKKSAKIWGLKTAVSMVDLTTLEGKDTSGKVASLCQKALQPSDDREVPPTAAVCVYPAMVRHARKCLGPASPVRIASVATVFPAGQNPLKLRLAEVRKAVSDGADEIDMVIHRGLFLAGELAAVQDEIAAVREGAELWQPRGQLPATGFFFKPTLLSKVTQSHRVAREEIFGPVLSVLTFRTLEEAVEKANNIAHGLSAGVWTDKGSRILRMAAELKAGVVWANTFNQFDPASPFGGCKESGFGREGGRQGLFDYVKIS